MQVIKSNTTDSLRIERDSRKIDLLATENTRINWNKGNIDQKGLPDNGEDLQNIIFPYAQILQMEENCEKILKK